MSVFRRGRRSVVRLAIGLGVLCAFPFVASGVAQAALAGGNPLTTTGQPDLRTLHTSQALDSATFCFDKQLNSIIPGGFVIGGYRWDTFKGMAAANIQSGNTNCVVGTVATKTTYGGSVDLGSYSIGTVGPLAAVTNVSTPQGNDADSTANLDANSHNGTTDHTAGPDLQSVFPPDTTNNRIIFTMDQPVACGTATQASDLRFGFYDGSGNYSFGQAIGCDSVGDISVQFGTPVSNAVRAIVIRGTNASQGQPGTAANFNKTTPTCAVSEQGGEPQTCNPTESVAVPGTSGTTVKPDLVSAAIVQSGGSPTNQIDYTFDQAVSLNSPQAGAFVAVTSNGQEVQGDAESLINATTVRVTFSTSSLQNFQELLVKASVYGNTGAPPTVPCAVTSSTTGQCNTTGGVAVGGNAGAFATGYTTGPDFRSVTFNTSTGSVVLQADQRINPASVTTAGWVLLDNNGNAIGTAPLTAAVANNAPFQSQVVLTWPTTTLASAVAVQIAGNYNNLGPGCAVGPLFRPNVGPNADGAAADTFAGGGFTAQGSECQIISPTAPGAAFADPAKGKVHVRWHYLSRKQQARVRTRLRHLRRHHR